MLNEDLCDFLSFSQANTYIVSQNRPRLVPPLSLPSNYLLIIPSCNAVHTKLLRMSLNNHQ